MTVPPPRCPWWRRKRTWAAVVLWLIVAYPLSLGPMVYAKVRGWLPPDAVAAFYVPLSAFVPPSSSPRPFFDDYRDRWWRLAERHEAATSD